jgi:hypothetical protein
MGHSEVWQRMSHVLQHLCTCKIVLQAAHKHVAPGKSYVHQIRLLQLSPAQEQETTAVLHPVAPTYIWHRLIKPWEV